MICLWQLKNIWQKLFKFYSFRDPVFFSCVWCDTQNLHDKTSYATIIIITIAIISMHISGYSHNFLNRFHLFQLYNLQCTKNLMMPFYILPHRCRIQHSNQKPTRMDSFMKLFLFLPSNRIECKMHRNVLISFYCFYVLLSIWMNECI